MLLKIKGFIFMPTNLNYCRKCHSLLLRKVALSKRLSDTSLKKAKEASKRLNMV